MHHHGYAWLGEKQVFDKESNRRPPPSQAPTAHSPVEVMDRHRQAVAEFPTTDVPPLQTAHWLIKPPSMVRGTWEEPKEAGEWLGLQLTEFAPRVRLGRGPGSDPSGAAREVGCGTADLGRMCHWGTTSKEPCSIRSRSCPAPRTVPVPNCPAPLGSGTDLGEPSRSVTEGGSSCGVVRIRLDRRAGSRSS